MKSRTTIKHMQIYHLHTTLGPAWYGIMSLLSVEERYEAYGSEVTLKTSALSNRSFVT